MSSAPEEHFVAETEFWVRFAETDAAGIVHHAAYLVWMEEGRQNYGRAIGVDYATADYGLHVTGLEVRYHAPARFGDRIIVRCWIEEAKSRTVTFGYEIKEARRGDLFVTGQVHLICINRSGQVARLPDERKSKVPAQVS